MSSLASRVASVLRISQEAATDLVTEIERLYVDRMKERFSQIRVSERIKRTNPFMVRPRPGSDMSVAALQSLSPRPGVSGR